LVAPLAVLLVLSPRGPLCLPLLLCLGETPGVLDLKQRPLDRSGLGLQRPHYPRIVRIRIRARSQRRRTPPSQRLRRRQPNQPPAPRDRRTLGRARAIPVRATRQRRQPQRHTRTLVRPTDTVGRSTATCGRTTPSRSRHCAADSSPSRARSSRNVSASVNCSAVNSTASAPATLTGESSTKTARSGSTPYRSTTTPKIPGSGLTIPSRPETTTASSVSITGAAPDAWWNVSADQFVRPSSRTPDAASAATISAVPGTGPAKG